MRVPRIPRLLYATTALVVVMMSVSASAAECVRPGENAVVSWNGAGSLGAQTRVYFRADTRADELFAEMKQGSATTLLATLPKTSADTRRIDYRIVSITGSAEKPLFTGAITVSNSCAMTRAASANRLVVGLTSNSNAPSGFLCDGIVGTVTKDGRLRAYDCGSKSVASVSRTTRSNASAKPIKQASLKKGGESFNGSNGNGHTDHGQGNGYGHCKEHQGPANGHDAGPPCAPVSAARP